MMKRLITVKFRLRRQHFTVAQRICTTAQCFHIYFELAFHSPETVGSWHARWSDRVAEHDLETLFWQWGERFPSLAGMERWQWQDMPFWQVIAEASLAAREAGHAVREMERWMVPNKLREAA